MLHKSGQRGAVAVEAALTVILLIGVALIASDMHRIGIERTRLENAASSAALNIAAQPTLTKPGLDGLVEIVMQGHSEYQHLVIMNVMQSGRINWLLERGGAPGLCEPPSDGVSYTGELPEDAPEGGEGESADDDGSTTSMIVVQACRSTEDIFAHGGLSFPEVLRVESIYRVSARKVALDEELQNENQIDDAE